MILPKKNDDFIKDLLRKGEDETLDFKLTITNPRKFAKTLVSFANTRGGIVLIGINDQRKIIGVDIAEEMHMVELAIKTNVKPDIVVAFEVFELHPDFGDSDEEVNLLAVKVEKSKSTTYYHSPEGYLVTLVRIKDMNIQVTNFSDRDLPPTMS